MVLRDFEKKLYILSMPTNGAKIDGLIISSHPLVTEAVLMDFDIQTIPVKVEKSFFGFCIPYIPIQINSSELIATNDTEKLLEIHKLHTNLVQNLSKWIGSSFSLRYIFNPIDKSIKIAFLGRVVAQAGQSKVISEEIAKDIENYFVSVLNFPVKMVETKEDLDNLLLPYGDLKFCEIWQREQSVNVTERTDIGDEISHPINIICPFLKPQNSTWLGVFKRISTEKDPVVINIHIEPTKLFDFEEYKLQEAEKIINGFVHYKIIRNTYTKDVEDLINKAIAGNYHRRWLQLTGTNNPLLEIVQVGSTNPVVAYEIAQVLASEITESINFDDAKDDASIIPSGYDIAPCLHGDENAALTTLKYLDILPRKYTNIELRGRSRYLTNTISASAAFRFPIPLKTGIAGIQTKKLFDGIDIVGNPITSNASIPLGYTGNAHQKLIGLPIEYFQSHILVAGTTRAGKTFTCIQIIGELWERGIPFLVIEPIKAHYRTLIKDTNKVLAEKIQVFTLGQEKISPFRLNPFELLPGIRVEEHITQISECFQASLPQFPALPMIIQDSLYNIYSSRGWQLSDIVGSNETRAFPTLGDFYVECISVAEKGGWSKEITQNIVGAVSVRIGGLLRGSKGLMLNTTHSIPFNDLMEKPTVLELMSLSNEERALVMMFLIVFLREYAQKRTKKGLLSHVTVIEEAHRIMSAPTRVTNTEIAPDTMGSAVKGLSEVVSEMGSALEGIIIAEQIPSRLIEDAYKNTNTKIIHRLPGEDDRKIISNTMNASEDQVKIIPNLENGEAVFFTMKMDGPISVKIINYPKGHGLPDDLSDEEIQKHMSSYRDRFVTNLLPFQGCKFCESRCKHREQVMMKAYQLEFAKIFRGLNEKCLADGPEGADWLGTVFSIRNALRSLRLDKDFNAVYCFVAHLSDFEISKKDHDRILDNFNWSLKQG